MLGIGGCHEVGRSSVVDNGKYLYVLSKGEVVLCDTMLMEGRIG